MEKEKKHVWWTLLLLIASGIAILFGYYMGMDNGVEEEPPIPNEEKIRGEMVTEETIAIPPVEETPSVKKEISNKKEESVPVKRLIIKEIRSPLIDTESKKIIDECSIMEEQIEDFFKYLDKKPYIKKFRENTNTYDIYKEILRRMSSRLPVPAGEGLSSDIMNNNIFHLFRIIDTTDIIMVKAVLMNEKQSMEINLEMFYSWFIEGEQCLGYEDIQPSWELLYHYSGFFLNTIGGRSYLYRRAPMLRLLLSYYCILIIHESDKQGSNSYGIDIVPAIKTIMREINLSPDLMYKSDYLDKLVSIQSYYNERGRQ